MPFLPFPAIHMNKNRKTTLNRHRESCLFVYPSIKFRVYNNELLLTHSSYSFGSFRPRAVYTLVCVRCVCVYSTTVAFTGFHNRASSRHCNRRRNKNIYLLMYNNKN